MFELSARNARGDILPLTGNKDFALRATGFNSLTANINTTKSANADGTRKNSANLNERNIVLYLTLYPPIELNRNKLYKFFNPKSDVRLFYKNELRDVYIDGVVETFECETFTEKEVAQISIICNDPYFKSAKDTICEFTNIQPLFKFPFAIPAAGIPFSESERETTKTINHGDVESGVIIEFYALTSQILQPAFYNLTTQKYIKLLVDMEQGDLIRINTNRGEKSITLTRDGITSNIINSMESGSKWFNLIAGENRVSYSADEGQNNLETRLITTNKYMGV